jgi:hypothetical protein
MPAQLAAANTGSGVDRRAVTTLNDAARRIRLGVRLHPADGYRLRSARWCSMATCGNRMKGRAYRRRRASPDSRRTHRRDLLAAAS